MKTIKIILLSLPIVMKLFDFSCFDLPDLLYISPSYDLPRITHRSLRPTLLSTRSYPTPCRKTSFALILCSPLRHYHRTNMSAAISIRDVVVVIASVMLHFSCAITYSKRGYRKKLARNFIQRLTRLS